MIPPTLQALIHGWPRGAGCDPVRAAVCRQLADALEKVLELHPVVPLDELRVAVRDGDVFKLIDKYTSKPANPHPLGTYLWAREEHARGNKMRRQAWPQIVRAASDWSDMRFAHDDFTATDWEVVP